MIRITTTLFVLAFWTSAALAASAQQPPPPEGPPQATNPYAQPYQPNAPAVNNTINPAMLAKAKTVFAELQAGKIDRSLLSAEGNSNLSDAEIADAQKMIGTLGKPVSFVQQQIVTRQNFTAAIYLVTFKNGKKIDFGFAVDDQGEIAGLRLGTPR
ncbi:MAG: hypothetical protein JO113_00710 [Candidatus Eremiobacteraeota bacterium]|nr:hypothetical protein [Candidatus Eremiobacteraeota bacterium]